MTQEHDDFRRRPLPIEGTSYRQSGPVDDVWLRRRSQPRKTLAGVIHLPVADGENRTLPRRLFGRVRDDDAGDVLFAFLGSQTSAYPAKNGPSSAVT